MLHCSYEVVPTFDGGLLSVAWSDSAGDLLQQATQHLQAARSHKMQTGFEWEAAVSVLVQTGSLLRRLATAAVEPITHVCIALPQNMSMHAWAWMQLPMLLEEAAKHGSQCLPRITRLTALIMASDICYPSLPQVCPIACCCCVACTRQCIQKLLPCWQWCELFG